MTRWQFFCSPEMKVIRTNIIICAALGYIIGIGSYVAILGGGLSALPVLVYAVYALILTFKFQKKWSAKKALLPAAKAKKEQIDKE